MSSFMVLAVVGAVSVLYLLNLLIFRKSSKEMKKKLPKGSMGYLPLIGESLSFMSAQKANRGEEWIEERVAKYGPIFKTSLMGSPTICVTGHAGTKFVLGADTEVLAPRQPSVIIAIMGEHSLLEISGPRYKVQKRAIMGFLKPESLQEHIKHMDTIITKHIQDETQGGIMTINTLSFMRKLAFHLSSHILFGITDRPTQDALHEDFKCCFDAILSSVPLNLPGTTFRKGLQARSRIINKMLPIINNRKEQLAKGTLNPKNDILTCMLSLESTGVDDEEAFTEEEVIDNFISLMIAGHDTSSVVLTWIIWKLAKDPIVYQNVLNEQMSIIKERKGGEEKLTWKEIQKMKYTWRVVQELMRLIPPFFGSFKRAMKDTNFGGYDIPEGWQVFWVSYGTHMNEEIFSNPNEFDPSRFESNSSVIPPYAYVPFGGGQHACIGNEFARVEAMSVIHHMVTKFEWKLINPDEKMFRLFLPYPALGLPILLHPK